MEHTRASLWQYLATLHVITAAFHSGDWRMQLWAWWNEFAMWSLAVMAASGVWIWRVRRATRGTPLRVHRYTALGTLALVAVYQISAVQMAHRTWLQAGPVLSTLNRIHRMRGVGFPPLLGTGYWCWARHCSPSRRAWLAGSSCGCALTVGRRPSW